MSENQIEIRQQRPDHHFRTEIPNIIFELGLDPYTLSVYVHLKRIAGEDGACWRSIKTLATTCGMSETKLKESLKILSQNSINSGSLISITSRTKPDGSADSNLIEIIDIWRDNGNFFRGGGSRGDGGVGRDTGGGGSPHAYKEEPSKEAVVVVSKEEDVTPVTQSKIFLKDDLYFANEKFAKGWSVPEIEYAFNALLSSQSVITDSLAYCEGIIKKTRTQNESKSKKEHLCQPKKIIPGQTSPVKQEKEESKSSGKGTPMLALQTLVDSIQPLPRFKTSW